MKDRFALPQSIAKWPCSSITAVALVILLDICPDNGYDSAVKDVNYDEIDQAIMAQLARDGRLSSGNVAKAVRVGAATVRRRRSQLIEQGVIKIAALADPQKLGFGIVAIIGVDVALDKVDSAATEFAKLSELKHVAITTGRYDIMLLGAFRNTEELSDFLQKKLPVIDGVHGTDTFITLSVRKGHFMPVTVDPGPLLEKRR